MQNKPNCHCAEQELFSGEAADRAAKAMNKAAVRENSWNEIYRCPACSQYWEMTYPAAGDVCCVEPELVKIRYNKDH